LEEKEKILFIYRKPSSFIEKDMNILRERFDVVPLQFGGRRNLFRLLRGILKTRVSVSWFALPHAAYATGFSRLFGRKSLVIAGGWDVVSMPEIGYGLMNNPKSQKKVIKTLNRASMIIAVSNSTKEWVLKWVKRDDVKVLYHGFDSERFSPCGEKENLVLSVGNLVNDATIKVKGLESLKKAVQLLPEIKFVLIGNHDEKIADTWRKNTPKNMEILDFQPLEKLIEYYQRAKVYAQLSYQESFGCALAEAMLCGCVPVTTRRGALPEVVGEAGFYVEYGDIQVIVENIKKALGSDKGGEARNRIMSHFPLENRKRDLIGIIDEFVKKT